MTNQKLSQNPIFVVGCPRSGTTLLQALIASQAGMITFPETHFFGSARNLGLLNQDFYTRDEANKILEEMEKVGRLGIRHEVLPFFDRISIRGRMEQKGLFELVLRTLAPDSIHPSMRWIEKTPSNGLCLERISRLYPDAIFVGIVRDPFNTIHSILRNFPPALKNKNKKIASVWAQHQKELLFYKDKFPDKMIIINYEDLAENSDITLKEVCNFLKIEFYLDKMEISNELKTIIVKDFEAWKASITSKISNNNLPVNQLFGMFEILYIQSLIRPYDELMGYKTYFPYRQKIFNILCKTSNYFLNSLEC